MLERRLGISLLILVSLFSGWSEAAEKERVVLRIRHVPKKNPEDPLRKLFERFSALHPEYDIRSSTGITLVGQDDSPIDSVLMAMAAGTAPDVLSLSFRRSASYIDQNFLYPLDEYVKEWEEDLDKKIDPKIWPIIRQKGPPDGKEHIYAIPYDGRMVKRLRYRKDLFKKAGLDPEKPPRNWDEFYEYAKRLTKPEEGQYGFFFPAGMVGAELFQNFIHQAGGDVVVQGRDGKWKAVYNSAAGVEALKFYQKLVRGKWSRNGQEYRGVVRTDSTYREHPPMRFSQLEEQVFFHGSANPDVIGIAALPAGPQGISASVFTQAMMGINAAAKDKRVRDAAWEYITFMASDEAMRVIIDTYVESGLAKFLNPEYLKKFGYEELSKEVPQARVDMHEKVMKHIRPEPYGKNCAMIYYELMGPMDEVLLSDEVDYQAVLDKAVAHTNERLLGEIPAEVMKKRRQTVGIFLIVLAGLLILLSMKFVKLMFEKAKDSVRAGEGTGRGSKGWLNIAWLFMLPALLTILVWQYYPLLRGSVMAFQDYRIMGGSKFIGIDNFVIAFYEPQFWIALKNTGIYVFLTIAIGFFLPVILALMLNEIPKGTLLYRIIYYLPAITSSMVIMLLWKQFYDPSPVGLFNRLLGLAGLPPQTWLRDPKLAMMCIIIPGIWGGLGAGSIIYLAALKSIPEELYEAAALDGASYFQKVVNVTLPRLKILLIITFVGVFIGSFHATERILMMTGGGPLYSTHVIGLEIFYNAFMYLRFGYATAMAWVLGTLLIGFTVYQLRILRSVRFTIAK